MTESRQTPQQIAEGRFVEHHPTPAMRRAYGSRKSGDETTRPAWRFNEHWNGGPLPEPLSTLVSDGLREHNDSVRRRTAHDNGHAGCWRH